MIAYFEALGDSVYQPTSMAGGAWKDEEIHFSPLAGLIVHCLNESNAARGSHSLRLHRISFDILGVLPAAACEVRVQVVRPGRTIELVEADVLISDQVRVRARAWFLSSQQTSSVAGGEPEPLGSPASGTKRLLSETWPGGFVASLDVRQIGPVLPGRAQSWLTTDARLIDTEESSGLADFVALIDTSNGLAVRQAPTEWMFPNVDLALHFYRQPTGRWVGMDTTVVFGTAGQGLTSTVLYDEHGAVGRAEQMLVVRPIAR